MATLTKSGATGFDGDVYRYVVVHGRMITPFPTKQMRLGYDNGGGFDATDQEMDAINDALEFRGVVLNEIKAGEEFVAVFDAADSNDYATEWAGNTITGLKLTVGDTGESGTVDIFSIIPTTADLFAARGSECYRTRSTCKSLENFRALVDAHLVPTLSLEQLDTIDPSTDIPNRDENAFWVAENVRFPIEPSGTIIEVGGNTGTSFFLGVTGDELVCRAGDSTVSSGLSTAKIQLDIAEFAGRTVTLVAEIDFDQDTVNLWEFDPLERVLSLAGTATASSGLGSTWTGTDAGAVGDDNSAVATGEDGGVFNGKIGAVRYHDSQFFDGKATDEFFLKEYFGRPIQEKPSDFDKVIRSYLMDVTTAPTKVSLGGSNRDTDPLGARASCTVRMTDQPGSGLGSDPYASDRLWDPLEKPGSFWGKWRVRQKFGRVAARVRVYEGYANQALSRMYVREYILDRFNIDGPDEITLRCRDILTKSELGRAQVPVQSPGLLETALAATGETVISIYNAAVTDYPAPGTVRINQEIFTYSATALNGSNVELTISARGQDRSDEDDHAVDSGVQLCRRYTSARVSDVITELLADDAGILAQQLDLANWDLEDDTYLSAYAVTTLITEPTAVGKLVGNLTESASSFIFWDERDQLVKLEALKSLTALPATLKEGEDIIEGSFRIVEKPREQATRVQVFYNPANWASDLREPADFLNGYIDADTDLEALDAYGVKQIRTVLSRWLTTNAQATQTASRLATRYADTPVELTMAVDAKNRDLGIGDSVYVEHYQFTDENGDPDNLRIFLITSHEDIVPGEITRLVMEDTTAGGFIYLIAPNTQGDYTGDGNLDNFYAFITDASGNTSDGLPGARIS